MNILKYFFTQTTQDRYSIIYDGNKYEPLSSSV